MSQAQEFTLRVGPAVFTAALHIEGARGDKGKQFMLVERQEVFVVAVFVEGIAEPVRIGRVDAADRLPEAAAGQGRTSATGGIRNHHRKAGIAGAGPDGGLAHP